MKEIAAKCLQIVGVVAVLSGCAAPFGPGRTVSQTVVEAVETKDPVRIDGRLDDPVWSEAPVYAMQSIADTLQERPEEGGQVQFAWDDEFFYFALTFDDSEVTAEGTANGELHYRMGDVAELFLKPESSPWYWELHVTPRANFCSFFIQSEARVPPEQLRNCFDLNVAAKVKGTLNDGSDCDRGWTAEMAVPIRKLTMRGDVWDGKASWRILVGRYNYSRHLDQKELTTMPKLSHTNFHLTDEYGCLRLVPATR